jgi:serine/threonine protein kinase
MINTTIGKYKIIRLIGEGGMASVYEAEHEMLGTKVAIKVLNPILSSNAQIKERFRNEAKLMASLDHPNITKVIDFDEQPQQLSIVMEFLNGEDLNQKIKRNGALNEKELTDVFSQTLSAFQYAHDKGIVHRDIKPSNIFLLPNGHVKILDFGIAKLFGQGSEMTQTGTQMGTPVYMSPEQVKADKTIDHRSDIYSLGVTMFFAIQGKPPYKSETESQFDIFNKIVYEPIPTLGQSKFKDLVNKACQKDRNQRFQSCREWVESWQSLTRNETQSWVGEQNDKTQVIAEDPSNEKTVLSGGGAPKVESPRFQSKRSNGNASRWIKIVTWSQLIILFIWFGINLSWRLSAPTYTFFWGNFKCDDHLMYACSQCTTFYSDAYRSYMANDSIWQSIFAITFSIVNLFLIAFLYGRLYRLNIYGKMTIFRIILSVVFSLIYFVTGVLIRYPYLFRNGFMIWVLYFLFEFLFCLLVLREMRRIERANTSSVA